MLPEDPSYPQTTSSETGILPRVDDSPRPDAPPPPDTLPEFDGEGGITGAMVLRTEGEDSAKDADDSPTHSAAKG